MKKMFLAILLLLSLTITSANAVEVTPEAKITGLYVAYFDRAADQAGLKYWTDTAVKVTLGGGDESAVFITLSGGFATHPTFKSTYDHLNNKEFVSLIYRNALGRDGDTEGIAYWTDLLDRGIMLRPEMVATFVELSLVTDLTKENYPNLSDAELAAAQLRQDLITNKVTVALAFTHQLGVLSNVVDSQNPEQDRAYLASIKIISEVTEDSATVSGTLDFLDSILYSDDQIRDILDIVLPDTIPPVITLNGTNYVTVKQGDTYTDAGATATDDVDGSVSVAVTGTVDIDTIGSYTITYTAQDSAGNESNIRRTVYVVLLSNILNDISMLDNNPVPIYTNYKKVKIIYLVPSDREENYDYTKALKDTYQNIQNWFLEKLQYQRTFALSDTNSVVTVIKSTHEEQWYTTENENANGVWVLYFNALNDVISIMGEKPSNETWIIYLAASITGSDCGVIEGGGGTDGYAVMAEDDLRGLAQYDDFACDYDANYIPGRWIGGAAHELGHAFGLDHPEPLDQKCDGTYCLMGDGYTDYPNTGLTEVGKQILNESDRLSSLSAINIAFDDLEKEYGLENEQTRKYTDNQKELYYRHYDDDTYILEKNAMLYIYYKGEVIVKGTWIDRLRLIN